MKLKTPSKKTVDTTMDQYGLPIWFYPVFVLVVILFAGCTEWDPTFGVDDITIVKGEDGDHWTRLPKDSSSGPGSIEGYPMYMDAAAMCVLGFGFLYVFSKYYVWGGVGMNFFICGFCFLWALPLKAIVKAMFEGEFHKTAINLGEMVTNCYVTAAVLISFGAFYGLTSPSQLILICLLEPFFMLLNEHVVVHYLHVNDAGGSVLVHMFGAFFGIAVALGMNVRPRDLPEEHRDTSYFSDFGAMIGSIVLWVFWPSFNGAPLYNDQTIQGRVVMNTYLAICASCASAFATAALSHKGKFEMLVIQNATLAGGVIIGMVSSFGIDPWVAVLVGGIGGCVSSLGYAYYHPFLEKLGILDCAAVQMLHGLPGLIGGLIAAFAVLADNQNYLYSYNTTWTSSAGVDRSRGDQFGYILLSILLSLGISIVGGVITGLLVRMPFCPRVAPEDRLLDHDFWDIHSGCDDPRKKNKSGKDNYIVMENVNNATGLGAINEESSRGALSNGETPLASDGSAVAVTSNPSGRPSRTSTAPLI